MNSLELIVARTRKRKSRKDMAALLGKTSSSYAQKECGKTPFSVEEVALISVDLDLTFEQFNTIFFDGRLPFGVTSESAPVP